MADETLDLFVENVAPLIGAYISLYELQVSIHELLQSWPEELNELAADLQYKGLREACVRHNIDFKHPALSPMRQRLELEIQHELAVMASLN